MENPDPTIYELQRKLVGFALIDRHHYLAGHERRENDAEHTLSVALQSWYLFQKFSPPLSLERIMKYATCHDFVELYAGDVSTYASDKARAQKEIEEQKSMSRFSDEHSNDFPDLIQTMQDYEDKVDAEAVFVWTVDKMQSLVMGYNDNWRPYIEGGITFEAFSAKMAELLEQADPTLHDFFEQIIEFSKESYPKN